MTTTIGNPLSWGVDAARAAGHRLGVAADEIGSHDTEASHAPRVRRIGIADLRAALRAGVEDFAACRSDVIFLCLLYPVIGVAMIVAAMNGGFLPLIFPAIAGFALVGPVAGVGLYEMSRRRERGEAVRWADALKVLESPRFGAVLALGILHCAIFLSWMITAFALNNAIMGPAVAPSASAFLARVLGTSQGWTLIVVGSGVGFLFAALVLSISVVSFPLLLDRAVGLPVAIATSIRLTRENPGTVAVWGLIVAGALVIGAVPFFLGLIVVLPILGHATWHLYRRAVG
jgi:uncharacterized membrane protein